MKKGKTKQARKTSRIPGVYVGEEVNTDQGPKKKVCFNIGGKWFFRMVDPEWKAPGRPSKSPRRKAKDKTVSNNQ